MVHDLSTQKGRNEYVESMSKKPVNKPTFFQAVLKPVKGNVLDHVYSHLKGSPNQMTLTERMGSEEAKCPECGGNSWIILPDESCAVQEGGKPYIECMHCGYLTHL